MPGWLTVLWSVSLEEQFYFLWPSAMKICNRAFLPYTAGVLWFSSQCVLLLLAFKHVACGANGLVQLPLHPSVFRYRRGIELRFEGLRL